MTPALHALLLGLGCAEPRAPGELVDPEAWSYVDAGRDPFSDRPADPQCGDDAWGPELMGPEMSLGIDTESCHYLVVRQPALAEVLEGDMLFMRLWHFELTASVDAVEAVAALWAGGREIWRGGEEIPSESAMLAPEWGAPVDIPEGDDVYFRISNHGSNAWNLLELSFTPPE